AASLRGAVLTGTDLAGAGLKGADLEGALTAPPAMVFIDDRPLFELIGEHQRWCDSGGMDGAFFKGDEADFRSAGSLRGVRLTGLSARRAIFFGMDLSGAQLQGADLSGADLRATNLSGADLRGVRLRDA